MPELPEVEVLVRHLQPLLRGKIIRGVVVRRERVIRPTAAVVLTQTLRGAKFTDVSRRGKFLLFHLHSPKSKANILLIGHLGMTGRMFLAPKTEPLPKHAAVVLDLGGANFVYEDPRYFGRLGLDASSLARMGVEPLGAEFTPKEFANRLRGSKRAIKIRLLDQELVAGVGNIYASEALFRAGIKPQTASGKLKAAQVHALWRSIRAVLVEAIAFGSTIPLHHGPAAKSRDGLFYYGKAAEAPNFYEERLRVYDRAGQPCRRCKTTIRRIVQAARSTFFCPNCQR